MVLPGESLSAPVTRRAMPITIRDIARKAGVSYTTVSLAFQRNSRISGRRRQQILEIAADLGYTPNRQARALKGGKTRTVGVLVSDITNPFYALMVRASHRAAAELGYEILVADSQWKVDHESAEIQRMLNASVDGLLACFGRGGVLSSKLLREQGVPHIALDTFPAGYRGSFVANDVPAAARLAVEHLLDVGCRRIVYFDADAKSSSFSGFEQLRNEFLKTLADHRAHVDENSVYEAGLDIEAGLAAMTEMKKLNPPVDGVFCANTLCAMGAIDAARRMGLDVPHDVAFVGVDDLDICRLDGISLTAVRQPFDQLAKIATEILVEAIEAGQPPSLQLSLKPEIVIRKSSTRVID